MKKTKLIIPAIGMLLLSTAASITGTVAWFSMNTTVTATGMQVEASADNTFLVITAGTTTGGNPGIADTTVAIPADAASISAAGAINASLKPVAPMGTLTSDTVTTLTSWGTAFSTNPAEPQTSAPMTALTSPSVLLGNNNYVAKQSFRVGRAKNTVVPTNDLRMNSITFTAANAGINVVVVCGENLYTYSATDSDGMTDVLAPKASVTEAGTENAGVLIDVYIFINGKDSNVFTNNITALTGSISMSFSVEAAA